MLCFLALMREGCGGWQVYRMLLVGCFTKILRKHFQEFSLGCLVFLLNIFVYYARTCGGKGIVFSIVN